MSKHHRSKEIYLKQYPEARKWLNQCVVCQTIEYKPILPEKIHPGMLAENIRTFYNVLALNELGFCDDCSKFQKS